MDDAHRYYKLQLAAMMEPLLGDADHAYYKALAEAPTEWDQMIKDANVLPLITALKSADDAFTDEDKFVGNYLSLRQNPDRFKPAAFQVIDDFRGTKALQRFDIFAKSYQLRNVWKLEPVLMNELNAIYGPIDWADPNRHLPLDWRNADSHAIYWAARGLQIAGRGDYSADATNTDRIVVHSLQNLFRFGKIFIYDVPLQPNPEDTGQTANSEQTIMTREIFLRPDLRMFEPYNEAVLAVLEVYKDLRERTYVSMQNGHRNMLKNAVLSFYQAGHVPQAQKIYDELRKLYPLDEFKVPLVVYARNRLIEELKRLGIFNAREIIQMLLQESYFRYAVHDDDEAFGREKMAEEVYKHYMDKFGDLPRTDLPEMPVLRYLALRDFLADWQYPPNLRSNLLGRIKIERPDLFEKLMQQEIQLLKQQQPQ